ncbi:tRNA pseudouridine(55) synthase TruB [bacterium]|nr:tRNA pseudouridine(55) synthase TruB [bacterium]
MTAGFLFVDKPGGMTSHDVVDRARRALGIRKVGHAGTLDPMATGLLVLGIGGATRLIRFIQGRPKTYLARMLMGVATDSLDADGAILLREPMPVSEDEIRLAGERFVGPIMQVPPMVSAVRVGGRRLHEIAREGGVVDREARPIEIYSLDVIEVAPSDYPEVTFLVRCSTGTYVRTLADDWAQALGGNAHLTALRREAIGGITAAGSISLEELDTAGAEGRAGDLVVSPVEGLVDYPAIVVEDELARAVGNGATIMTAALDAASDGLHSMVGPDGRLLAMYSIEGARACAEVVLS